jgi:hypothetical protein
MALSIDEKIDVAGAQFAARVRADRQVDFP